MRLFHLHKSDKQTNCRWPTIQIWKHNKIDASLTEPLRIELKGKAILKIVQICKHQICLYPIYIYNNHMHKQFQQHKHATELSTYILNLKESDTPYSIKWRIIKQCRPYSNKTKRCNLCLYEKFVIICHPELSSLNTRNELISTCRHRKKQLLSSQ